MSQILLLDKLLKEYKLWTIRLKTSASSIENTLLQTSSSDSIEEKFISIGISSIIVYVVNGILGLVGVINGEFLVSVGFFILGLFLSRFITKKIFGKPRTKEELTRYELNILDSLENIYTTHTKIRDNINQNKIVVNFVDYPILQNQFKDTVRILENFDKKPLAYKYRLKYTVVVQNYKKQIKTFDYIYANKRV